MSGGTRCNVTHREVSERDFNSGTPAVVRRVLSEFPADAARGWLESLGVALKLEASGKYFPVTDDARTVLEALTGACERAGIEVAAGARAVRLERAAAGTASWRVGIQRVRDSAAFAANVAPVAETHWPLPAVEPGEWREAAAVVLATGGLSFPRTGSDGTGYSLATALGHTLVPPVPALTPLAGDDPLFGALQGVTIEAELTLRVNREVAARTRGSLLFAHFGLSGPAALDLSRHWLRAESRGERALSLSVVPGETPERLQSAWLEAAADHGRSVRRWLGARLPDRLAAALCAEAGVEPAAKLGQVPRTRRAALIALLTARPLAVTGTLGYEKAEVTAGGVPLSEVDPRTLESRIAPGLFLCGEILDVDGRLGGFNFQWAWSSGTAAGRAAADGDVHP